MTITYAPLPSAALAAVIHTTPAPKITTAAGATPVIPPSKIPLHPFE